MFNYLVTKFKSFILEFNKLIKFITIIFNSLLVVVIFLLYYKPSTLGGVGGRRSGRDNWSR